VGKEKYLRTALISSKKRVCETPENPFVIDEKSGFAPFQSITL
jgi:hypothetical protein